MSKPHQHRTVTVCPAEEISRRFADWPESYRSQTLGGFLIYGTCHPEGETMTVYDPRTQTLTVACRECHAEIVTVAVRREAEIRSDPRHV